MGIPAKTELTLKGPENGEFYSGDENISGSLKLKLSKSLPIKRIMVHLKGFTETQTKVNSDYMMSQNGMLTPIQDNRSYHRLIDLEKRLFPPDNVWDALEGSSKPFKVHPGEYDYEFKFEKLKGKRPRCLKNHTKTTICFLKRRDIRLPPSFNLKWKELNKIDNLDLFFYSFGKVIYMIEVEIEMGKPKSWFKPFDKMIRDIKTIEYIPTVKDITYPTNDEERPSSTRAATSNSIGSNSRNTVSTLVDDNVTMINSIKNMNLIDPTITAQPSDNAIHLFSENGLPRSSSRSMTIPSSLTTTMSEMGSPIVISDITRQGSIGNSISNQSLESRSQSPLTEGITVNRYKFYRSTFKLNLPTRSGKTCGGDADIENSMWVEVRSKNDGFEQIFRNDPLFKKNCNRFDRVFLTCKGKLSDIKKMAIKPVRIQLNLIENATYLSKGIANENYSSLRLVELAFDEDSPPIFNIQELRPRVGSNVNVDEETYVGKSDCQIKFRDHPQLRRLLFNEEDYKHRGNRLFSFKTCSIRRIFYFEFIIDWNIDGIVKQTEIRIDPIQIYCQIRENNETVSGNSTCHTRRNIDETDFLPRYVEPPVYNEFPEDLVESLSEDTEIPRSEVNNI